MGRHIEYHPVNLCPALTLFWRGGVEGRYNMYMCVHIPYVCLGEDERGRNSYCTSTERSLGRGWQEWRGPCQQKCDGRDFSPSPFWILRYNPPPLTYVPIHPCFRILPRNWRWANTHCLPPSYSSREQFLPSKTLYSSLLFFLTFGLLLCEWGGLGGCCWHRCSWEPFIRVCQ